MDSKIKRRDILRRVGAAAGGASLIVGASDTAVAHPDRERDRGTELTGADRAQAIGKALRNEQFRALLWNFYSRRGFRPTGTVNVLKVDGSRVVSLPFAVEHEHDSRHVTWVDRPEPTRLSRV